MKSYAVILAVYLLALYSAGCAVNPNANAKAYAESSGKVDTGLVVIDTSATSALDSLKAARGTASAAGQGAIDAASRAIATITKAVAASQAANKAAENQYANELKAREAAQAETARVKAGWGYRLQTWVAWAWFWVRVVFWIFVAMAIFHLIAGPLSKALPPPWNAIVLTAGNICNPLGWLSIVIQRMHLNAVAAKSATPIVIAPGESVAKAVAAQAAATPLP